MTDFDIFRGRFDLALLFGSECQFDRPLVHRHVTLAGGTLVAAGDQIFDLLIAELVKVGIRDKVHQFNHVLLGRHPCGNRQQLVALLWRVAQATDNDKLVTVDQVVRPTVISLADPLRAVIGVSDVIQRRDRQFGGRFGVSIDRAGLAGNRGCGQAILNSS